jgi:hypothetical protein
MFFGKQSPHFDFFCRKLFDPEGLGAEARQFSKPLIISYSKRKAEVLKKGHSPVQNVHILIFE